jgi:23S rRNA U2552 (ribose-2'-O)-methylase RlmE/FtsJ
MRSEELSLENYETDKQLSGYIPIYDRFFQSLINQKISLLELGINKGGSLKLWRDYFPNGQVTGIDINPPKNIEFGERINIFQANQTDTIALTQIASSLAPKGFDIIIDDASHIGYYTKKSFWHLFNNHLKSGGMYFIEDWGTGYWSKWRDGKNYSEHISFRHKLFGNLVNSNRFLSHFGFAKIPFKNHGYGMVGFIKQLIDEQGAADNTKKTAEATSLRDSKFKEIFITTGIVLIIKK